MIIDPTGILLTPGNNGNYCMGNGEYRDADGSLIECCCDECDYAKCCLDNACKHCSDIESCPKQHTLT